MEIYNLLPDEIQNKIKYYVLEHPAAAIIKEKIHELRCDEFWKFRDKNMKIFAKIDGRDYFANEVFRRIKQSRKYELIVIGDAEVDDDLSESSEEYLDEIFERMFFVSSSSDSDSD